MSDKCPICQNNFSDLSTKNIPIITLSCKHKLCLQCNIKLSAINCKNNIVKNKCSLCRKKYKNFYYNHNLRMKTKYNNLIHDYNNIVAQINRTQSVIYNTFRLYDLDGYNKKSEIYSDSSE